MLRHLRINHRLGEREEMSARSWWHRVEKRLKQLDECVDEAVAAMRERPARGRRGWSRPCRRQTARVDAADERILDARDGIEACRERERLRWVEEVEGVVDGHGDGDELDGSSTVRRAAVASTFLARPKAKRTPLVVSVLQSGRPTRRKFRPSAQ